MNDPGAQRAQRAIWHAADDSLQTPRLGLQAARADVTGLWTLPWRCVGMEAIIVIAASEGALEPLREIVAVLPRDCAAAVFIVWHIGSRQSILPTLLGHSSELPAKFAADFEGIRNGFIYVAPPDFHMRLAWGCTWLDRGPKIHRTRPAADPLFVSAAEAYGAKVTGIVLSGGDGDGASGLKAIKDHGGRALVQPRQERSIHRCRFRPSEPTTRRRCPCATLRPGFMRRR